MEIKMIVFKRDANGWAHDLRPVSNPEADDIIFSEDFGPLPDIETLHSPEYIAARDAAVAAALVRDTQKAADIAANLPSRAQVGTAVRNISSLADAKVFLEKLTNVVYWLAKNQGE